MRRRCYLFHHNRLSLLWVSLWIVTTSSSTIILVVNAMGAVQSTSCDELVVEEDQLVGLDPNKENPVLGARMSSHRRSNAAPFVRSERRDEFVWDATTTPRKRNKKSTRMMIKRPPLLVGSQNHQARVGMQKHSQPPPTTTQEGGASFSSMDTDDENFPLTKHAMTLLQDYPDAYSFVHRLGGEEEKEWRAQQQRMREEESLLLALQNNNNHNNKNKSPTEIFFSSSWSQRLIYTGAVVVTTVSLYRKADPQVLQDTFCRDPCRYCSWHGFQSWCYNKMLVFSV
jgi:hypothetical protein